MVLFLVESIDMARLLARDSRRRFISGNLIWTSSCHSNQFAKKPENTGKIIGISLFQG
ncbi:hypothetical protein YC2023_090693 [Brassica napus]